MTIAQRAVRGAAIILASSYTNMALGIGYGILMARLLTPEHFGIYAGAVFFATLFDVRGKLGLDYALIHNQSTDDALLATHWLMQIGAAVLSLLLIGLAAFAVMRLHYPAATAPLMFAIAGSLLLEGLGSTARAALEKDLRFGRSSLIITGALLLSYLIALFLAWQGFQVWALLGQAVVNALAGSLGFWWIYRRLRSSPLRWQFDPAIARWMVRFGATMTVAAIATTILLQFDNYLVLTFVGSAAAGYYVQAYKVAQWPTGLVTHVIARASLPTYAKLQNDLPRLSRAFEMSLWLILTLATPLALAIFAAAPDFLRLLYGDVWLPAAPLLRFLIGYSVLRPLLDDTGALFTALGQPGRVTIIVMAQAILLALLATPLTLGWGAIGTAIGVGITFVIGIGLAYHSVNQVLKLNWRWIFGPPLIAALGSIVLYLAMTRLIDLNLLPLIVRVFIKGGVAAGLFLGIVVLLQYRTIFQRTQYLQSLLFSR